MITQQTAEGRKPRASGFDFLVFIGRFQPLHKGHLTVIRQGLEQAEQLIILCGSAHQSRSTRNPWTVDEREAMIRNCLTDADNRRVKVVPLMDSLYNDELWVRNVQSLVQGMIVAHFGTPHRAPKVGLIGHSKDQSSFYLNLFPQWQSVKVDNVEGISSTPLRQELFSQAEDKPAAESLLDKWQGEFVVPAPVVDQLKAFLDTSHFAFLQAEQQFVNRYKSAWSDAPYSPVFVTVDALVVQSGHILLVERKARPGKGLWAVPGGFVDPEETLQDACLRELREETRLKVPTPVLKGSIKRKEVFDDPYRSARGRTITHAFYIELEPNSSLPKVKGGDDARSAFWLPMAELNPSKLFEDHYFIIQQMTGM